MGRGTLKVGVGRGRGAEPHCGDGGGEEDDDGDDDDDDDDDSGTEDTPSEDTEDDDGAGGGTRRDMAGDVPKARVRQSPHVWWRVGVQKAQCVIVLCTLMPLCLWGASHMVGLGFWRAGTFTFYSQHPSSVPRNRKKLLESHTTSSRIFYNCTQFAAFSFTVLGALRAPHTTHHGHTRRVPIPCLPAHLPPLSRPRPAATADCVRAPRRRWRCHRLVTRPSAPHPAPAPMPQGDAPCDALT